MAPRKRIISRTGIHITPGGVIYDSTRCKSINISNFFELIHNETIAPTMYARPRTEIPKD